MEGSSLILLIILIVLVAMLAYVLLGTRKSSASVGEGELRRLMDGAAEYLVDYDMANAEEYDGADEDDDENIEYYGSAAKKTAAKVAKKTAEKVAKKTAEKVVEKKMEEKEEKEEKKDKKDEGEKSGFRGHFLSERVVEKHDEATGKVITYRVSVRGNMKDTHRVIIKLKELTEDHKTDPSGRMRKLKLKGTSSGEYETTEKPEKNRGKFTAEEKEPAVRLLHGALHSSMLDEPIREKIIKLVTEKL